MTHETSFMRRRNPDSTIDSICESCYQTIAKGRDEQSLTEAEQSHACYSNAESDRLAFARHDTY